MATGIGAVGGGAANTGGTARLRIDDSTIRDNFAADSGGGIYNDSIRLPDGLEVEDTTLSNNVAGLLGGGYFNAGRATLVDCTISDNDAKLGSGSYRKRGAVTTERAVEYTRNVAYTDPPGGGGSSGLGGGVYAEPESYNYMGNSIYAQNIAGSGSPDLYGPFISLGHNLVGDGTGATGLIPSDLVGTSTNPIDALLSPLGDYGGPTQTHILLPGSPALNAGDNALVTTATDQRGFTRIVNGTVDIGAVEMQSEEQGLQQPGQSSSSYVSALLAFHKRKKRTR